MPSRGDFTWHPPFLGLFTVLDMQTLFVLSMYTIFLPYMRSYGILEYRKHNSKRKGFHNRRRRHLLRMSAPFFLNGLKKTAYGRRLCKK